MAPCEFDEIFQGIFLMTDFDHKLLVLKVNLQVKN